MNIRVLIVEDSPTARHALDRAIAFEGSGFQVVGTASAPDEALRLCKRLRPDIVTMDIHLGDDDGVATTKRIMTEAPVPILIVTGDRHRDPALVFRSLEAGALGVLGKLPHHKAQDYPVRHRRMLRTLRALSKVPVVKRSANAARRSAAPRRAAPDAMVRLILIGSSTGGPRYLLEILSGVEAPAPLPIIVVQHIMADLVEAFASWLASQTRHRVTICRQPAWPARGQVYLAPPDCHLRMTTSGMIAPTREPEPGRRACSIDELFKSVAANRRADVLAVLLSGMGRDGAAGLAALRDVGALTVAQDPGSCVVESMPATAIELGAARYVLPPKKIAELICGLRG